MYDKKYEFYQHNGAFATKSTYENDKISHLLDVPKTLQVMVAG